MGGDVIVKLEPDEGEILVDLSDTTGNSNTDQEFYLVIVNTGEDDLGYSLQYVPKVSESAAIPSLLSWTDSGQTKMSPKKNDKKVFEGAIQAQLSPKVLSQTVQNKTMDKKTMDKKTMEITKSDMLRLNPMELRRYLDE